MKKILVLATLLTIVGVSYGRTPTSGNMWNVSDYSGTYGWEINTDGSFVPMTSSCVLGNATYPIATATITAVVFFSLNIRSPLCLGFEVTLVFFPRRLYLKSCGLFGLLGEFIGFH